MKSMKQSSFYAQTKFADVERKAAVIQLFLNGVKPMEIVKQTGYNKSTVYTVLYKEKLLKRKKDL